MFISGHSRCGRLFSGNCLPASLFLCFLGALCSPGWSQTPALGDHKTLVAKNHSGTGEFKVWFQPDRDTSDLIELFESPDKWACGRGKIDVYKFNIPQLTQSTHPECPASNLWPSVARSGAIAKLRSWGIEVAMDANVFLHERRNSAQPALAAKAEADEAAKLAIKACKNVDEAGGELRYIAMNEPLDFGGPKHCNFGLDVSANAVAQYIATIHSACPGVEIGDTEPYPFPSVRELKHWISALQNRRVQLAFFHVDINFTYLDRHPSEATALPRDLRDLEAFCRARSIPFGVILWSGGGAVDSDKEYFDLTMQRIPMVKAAVGLPEHVIFQSWIWNHAGRKTVPTNVPETSDFTHTNLVNRGLTLLVDNDAGLAATQSPPPSMKAGASFPLVVTCVNKGPVAWTKKRGYELGIQVFQGNSCVGVERVALTDDEAIAPGASKTFHFTVNAPLAPGGYVYRWQMFQQMGNWLGTPSPSYPIQVTP